MLNRLQHLSKKQSLFLFGPRGVGKSTLIESLFPEESSLNINLLRPDVENHFTTHPEDLKAIVEALGESTTHVIIDDIQKTPKLLDIVHFLIEKTSKHFVMSGSSVRKLKRGAANLLAGRAFVYHFAPFSMKSHLQHRC
jgi:uncharacterized protein